MDFWGSIVVAAVPGLLAHEPAMAGFGYMHWELRSLGGDWQLVETQGWGTPDVAEAARRLAAATGGPVLGAHISDGYCANVYLVLPDGTHSHFHLPEPSPQREAFEHIPDPPARSVDDVTADLQRWAESSGLHPPAGAIPAALSTDGDAYDMVYAAVRALGFERFDEPRPWTFRPDESMNRIYGAAYVARCAAVLREAGDTPAPWEAEAIALEEEIWTAIYADDPNVAGLAARCIAVHDARAADED
ncbi:hypothetical protein GCM10009827_059080 [Dactylosporangium maewongense]|uniref:Uncharacterized protein n=1 Tax=Dactylosporangium maewongense TaxID=634393 RepID=A0ABP4LX06_9ACTN